jgi:hypothetical protein
MQILPPTGGGPGNPWVFAVRDDGLHVLDVVDYNKARGYQRTKEIIRKLAIAEAAISYFDHACPANDRCAPNCVIANAGPVPANRP